MTKTIVALYDDIVVARQVVEDLVNANFERTSISLITNDAHNQYSQYLDKDYAPREDAVTALEGARFGSVVGALTGLLVSMAALTIPGIGLAIAAGPVTGALTGMVAGAITGGVTGALVKSGVPEDEAPYYAEGIRRGGTLISLETADTLRAEDIMNRSGSTNIHERATSWRQTGWQHLEAEPVEHDDTDLVSLPAVPLTAPFNSHTNPLMEPQIDSGDTARSLPVMVTSPETDVVILPAPITTETVPEAFETESLVENERKIRV